MNKYINKYFDDIEFFCIECPIIISYQIIKRESSPSDGKIRIKLEFIDNSNFEFFEYVNEINGQISILKYSYHWQGLLNTIIKRWDNAPHFQNLQNFPHHVHIGEKIVKEVTEELNFFKILKKIMQELK